MTCIAAIADSKTGKVYIGGDSMYTAGSVEQELRDSKIWSVSWKEKNWLFGFCGSLAAAQLIQYQVPLPSEEFQEDESVVGYLSRCWVPKIRELADRQHLSTVKNGKTEFDATLLIASQGKLFETDPRFGINEVSLSYASMGSGGQFANGVLWSLDQMKSNLSPAKRIRKAIRGASRFCSGVGGRIDVLSA